MKLKKQLFSLLLSTLLLLCLVGCQSQPAATEPTQPELSPQELYAQAFSLLTSQQYINTTAEITRTTVVGSETFTKTESLDFTWKDWGTDTVACKVIEDSTIGEVENRFTEVFREGTLYLTYGNMGYCSDMTSEEFMSRWVSLDALSESLYADISAEETDTGTLIRFEAPSSPESWAAPEYARLHSAAGTVRLDAEGNITEYTYEAEFTQGAAQVTLSAQIEIADYNTYDLTLVYPDTEGRYLDIGHPDVFHLLLDANNYLYNAQSVTTQVNRVTSIDAVSAVNAYTKTSAFCGGDEDFSGIVNQDSVTTLYRRGKAYKNYHSTLEEAFLDGQYSISRDGKTEDPEEGITAEDMRFWVLDSPCNNIWSITDATLTDMDGICLIELDGTNELAQHYSIEAAGYMLNDDHYLESQASAYKTNAMDMYFVINRDTGLITTCGTNFSGTYTIDSEDSNITMKLDQTIQIGDPNAYEAVHGESLPEEAPEKTATPLFYHVTGQDGQEMWLMGTIHIGDSRTGFLPQEIYTALDSSSALAVEFDDEDFEKLLEKDQKLLNRLVASYYYTDGTTTSDHLDPAVFAYASNLMKATGTDLQYTVAKPFLWEQTISSYFLEQSYNLTSEKGLDGRLMDYARDKNIKILNVESAISQIEMLSGFSDDLQEYLLASTSYTPYYEQNAELEELYELWCAGDEAALIEYLNSEPEDLTKKELQLHREYTKAISTDRDKEMVEVAKGYLESGDVVFYAVGLAHLLAEEGLVNSLRKAGYTVELVTYSN